MNITKSMSGNIPVLEIDGRLDINWANTFEECVRSTMKDGFTKIVLDCNKMSFISSAGLRIFIIIQKELSNLGGELCLFGCNSNTRKIFEITGYINLFAICDNRLDALARFGA